MTDVRQLASCDFDKSKKYIVNFAEKLRFPREVNQIYKLFSV